MKKRAAHTTPFNTARFRADMELRGWFQIDLARVAQLPQSTVSRFLGGAVRSPRTAKKLADALGQPVARYYRNGRLAA